MSEQVIVADSLSPASGADLETVLSAWHSATLRLEQTHEALRGEVRRLTDELEIKNRELARKNRLADLGQMAAHIAHEVGNKLVPVTLYLSLLRRRISDDRGSVEVLDKLESGFTALNATIKDLLQFTSDREPHLQTFLLGKLIDDVKASVAPRLSSQAVKTVVDVPKDCLISADRNMLSRAVLNLTLNGLDAMPDGGTLTVTAASGPRGVELEIADSGPGLPDEARCRAFEPFFTTKGGSAGLGLAIVCRIAEAHHGEVIAANCPEGGAAFTICIPSIPPAQLEAAA